MAYQPPSRTRFYRDKRNGKIMGVCAGIADYTGIDVTVVADVATNVAGGSQAWAAAGLPFVKDDGTPGTVA